MPQTSTKTSKADRLSIRADAEQKQTLARAAQARRMNVSQFVLQVSVSEAERILREEAQIRVSPAEYERLCQIMDVPPAPAPRLRAALAQAPVWDE